jgi:hypothetical protein
MRWNPITQAAGAGKPMQFSYLFYIDFEVGPTMTKCGKPLKHLATSSTKSSKWSALIGRAGRLSTKSHSVSEWFHALCLMKLSPLHPVLSMFCRQLTMPDPFRSTGLV